MVLHTKILFYKDISNYFDLDLVIHLRLFLNFVTIPFQFIFKFVSGAFFCVQLIFEPFFYGLCGIYDKLVFVGHNLLEGLLNFIYIPNTAFYYCVSIFTAPLRSFYYCFAAIFTYFYNNLKSVTMFINSPQSIEFFITLSQYVDLSPI